MPADLEQMFERLAERADAASLPGLDDVRARARDGRYRTIISAAVAVLVVVAVMVPLLTRQAPSPPVIRPDVPPPIRFLPFEPDAKPVVPFDQPARIGLSFTGDTRSYVMWMGEDDSENVAVIDLATGRTVFPPVNVGKFGDTNGMQVARDGIVLLTEQGFPSMPDTIIVLDPGTGRELWRLPYSFNDTDRVLYDDTLVLTWIEQGRTEGIDLKTGAVRWTFSGPSVHGGTNPVQTRAELSRPVFGLPSTPDDRRVVVHTKAGRAKVLDVDTGRVLADREAPLSPGATSTEGMSELVVDGKLYAAGETEMHEIDLFGDAPPRVIHHIAEKGYRTLMPCADRLICLIGDEATAVDPVAAKVEWTHALPRATRGATTSGRHVLIPAEEGAVLLGPGGERLLPEQLRGPLMGGWVDGGNLVLWSQEGVSGLSLATGKLTKLGDVRLLGYPSWDSQTIVLVAAEGVFVHRMAG